MDAALAEDELNEPFESNIKDLRGVVEQYTKTGGVAFHIDRNSEGDRENCCLIIKLFLVLLAPPKK